MKYMKKNNSGVVNAYEFKKHRKRISENVLCLMSIITFIFRAPQGCNKVFDLKIEKLFYIASHHSIQFLSYGDIISPHKLLC